MNTDDTDTADGSATPVKVTETDREARAIEVLAETRIAARSLLGDCPDAVALQAMIAFADTEQAASQSDALREAEDRAIAQARLDGADDQDIVAHRVAYNYLRAALASSDTLDQSKVEIPYWATAESPSRALGMAEPKTEIDRIAYILFDTFAKVEPKEGITRFPASYWATFADMARAVIAAAPPTEQSTQARIVEAVAAERERCAKVADHYAEEASTHADLNGLGKVVTIRWLARAQAATRVAAAIRESAS